MKTHKNFGIAAAILMTITIITGIDDELRKTHGFWAALTVFSLIGALISGRKMAAPKIDEESDQYTAYADSQQSF